MISNKTSSGRAWVIAFALVVPAALILAEGVNASVLTTMPATLPTARSYGTAVWDGSNAYVFGGWDGWYLNQVVRYNPSANTVTTMGASLPTSGTNGASAVWDGSNAYVFGGYRSAFISTIVRYNPATDTATVALSTLPSGRDDTVAVWDG